MAATQPVVAQNTGTVQSGTSVKCILQYAAPTGGADVELMEFSCKEIVADYKPFFQWKRGVTGGTAGSGGEVVAVDGRVANAAEGTAAQDFSANPTGGVNAGPGGYSTGHTSREKIRLGSGEKLACFVTSDNDLAVHARVRVVTNP
ncbi:MAG TPA: hypothetical protein VK176_01680 [Phycisphaerales bacterium]|nr:hypothetical protein [Phycisphaerales bacterium]